MPDFGHWESFYVVVGAAAGALIGLQFVVMTLIAEKPPLRQAEAGAATLLLLFVGIHNAWDSVVYLTTHSSEPQPWRFVPFRKRT